jgi:putative ABC transport system permease protein
VLPLIRRAVQGLRRVPGFTALCVLTLAVGIGAESAVFSVVDAVLLRSLPYPRADRLVGLWHELPGLPSIKGPLPISDALYLLYRDHAPAFSGVAIYRTAKFNLMFRDAPERVAGAGVTASLFKVLRVAPHLGHAFTAADERPGAPPVALVSDALWRRRMGADPRAVGSTLRIDGVATQVIGVMPAGFAFPHLDSALWVPQHIDPGKTNVGGFNFTGVARLAGGATPASAAAQLNRLVRGLDRWVPEPTSKLLVNARLAALIHPLRDDQVGGVGQALWLLFGAVGCILVIACANVANLLIVRGEARQRELSVYAALGAPRGQLLGGVLCESLLIGAAGGAGGMLLAWGGVRLLAALQPAALARLAPPSVDARMLGFAALLAIGCSLLSGLIPAWRASRVADLATQLRGGGRAMTTGRGRQRLRQVLVGLQLALALVLLTGSALMLRSFRHLAAADPGFRPANVLTFDLALPEADYPSDQAVASCIDRAVARIAGLPGVVAVGATSGLPFEDASMTGHKIEDRPLPDTAPPPVFLYQFVTPGYFAALGIPLLAGRGLEAADAQRRTGAAVVSAALAHHFWPQGALGKRLHPGVGKSGDKPRESWYTVVGVVGDIRQRELTDQQPPEAVYYPFLAKVPGDWVPRDVSLAVRASLPPASLTAAVRGEIRRVAPGLPVDHLQTLDELLHRERSRIEFSALMVMIATAVAVLLGVVGLYGFVSYLVGQRSAEIGIRMALGATERTIRWMILRESLFIAAGGVAVGLPAALLLAGTITALLFQVSRLDPLSYAVAPLLLVTVSLVASYLPADRAAQVEPRTALHRVE